MSVMHQRPGQRPQRQFIIRNPMNPRFNNMNKRNFNRFPNNKAVGQIQNQNVNGTAPRRDVLIRQNLQHMQQVALKKKVAQERYYGSGRSPMIKTSSGPFIKQENVSHGTIQQRLSVQQRLGNRGRQNFPINNNPINKRPIFVNTRPNQNKFIGGMRSDKIQRMSNMQQKKFKNTTIKTINSAGKVVYLQPVTRRPGNLQPINRRPANYTVRVENDRKHHVLQGLNPVLQREIQYIQQSTSSRQIVNQVSVAPAQVPPTQNIANLYDVDRLPIVATTRTLHERFSMI